MGFLRRFDLPRYREHYGLATLFETGTFRGGGVASAIDAGFERIYSVEIIDELYQENVSRFAEDESVTILKGESAAVLDAALPEIESNILFWLDAHCPGADHGLRDYNAEPDERVRCPLSAGKINSISDSIRKKRRSFTTRPCRPKAQSSHTFVRCADPTSAR